MFRFYILNAKSKSSMLELASGETHKEDVNNMTYASKVPLAKEIRFKLKKGRKPHDIITYCDKSTLMFFSKHMLDMISEDFNIDGLYYPITVEGVEEQYYGLYNLPAADHFNKLESKVYGEPILFTIGDVYHIPNIFTFNEVPMIVINARVYSTIYLRNRFTNIDSEHYAYYYTNYEIDGWKKYWERRRNDI